MIDVLKEDMKIITEYLIQQGGAKAIILCGSRAVGDYRPNSDWDLKLLIGKEVVPAHQLTGYELDITVHDLNTNFSWEEFGWKLRFCEVVFDTPEQHAKKLVETAHEFYAKGPKPWSVHYAKTRLGKVRRYEQKFKALIEAGSEFELHQRLNWHFLENSYTWWYGLRGEWEPRPQQILDNLKQRDPEFALILGQIVKPEVSDYERVNLFQKLHQLFFASKEYQDYINPE